MTVERLLLLCSLSFVVVGVANALGGRGSAAARLVELTVITGLATGLAVSGYLMCRRVDDPRYVLYSTLGLGLLTGSLSLLASSVQVLKGYTLNEPVYYAVVMAAGGAAVGPYLGFYYARLQRSNEELSERYRDLSALNQRLAVANRVLRHNLRNDLTVVDGVAKDLQRRVGDDGPTEHVDLLNRRTDSLLELSETMDEIRGVWNTDERVVVDLATVLHDLLDDLRTTYPEVTLRTEVPDSAPVAAHPKLGTAVRELLSNAVTHNDPSELTLTVTVEARPESNTCRLVIADDGCGFDGIEQTMFSDADPDVSPLEHGVGLGLWLVYWTVEESEGAFTLTNDGGAVVRADLPTADPADDAVGVGSARPLRDRGVAGADVGSPTHS